MNWWAIGGLLCMIYTLGVGGLAMKKSPGLLKLVKMKLGNKDMSDRKAQIISYVAAGVVFVAGIVFFILSAR